MNIHEYQGKELLRRYGVAVLDGHVAWTPEEAEALMEHAYRLMQKYAIDQAVIDARRAKDEATDAEFAENLKVKEALVAKAEALMPIKDVKAVKRALRPIQDAWDEAGRVPRSAVRRIEGRMRAVEDAVREAENTEWRRTNPETTARAEGLAAQLQDSITELEAQLARAQAAGDSKAQAEAEAALTARRAWLDQVLRSAKA